MKNTLLYIMLGIIVMAFTSCHDDSAPFDSNLLNGHWYAEIPISGNIENWRTEEGEMTTYDHIGVILLLYPLTNNGVLAHLYLQNGEMVNYDGFNYFQDGSGYFDFAVDSDGNISVSNYKNGTFEPKNLRYVDGKIIGEINGQTVIFTHPSEQQENFLEDVWQMLVDEGVVGGSDDGGSWYGSDISDQNATTPARAPRRR